MATIALYANKINQMPELIKDIKQSVIDYKSELSALKSKTLTINSSACDLDDVISSIQSSTQTQEDKVTSLDTFIQGCEEFITDVQRIDEDVADIIRQRKDDFYEAYYYLKPECEKNGWEKFCDGCKKVGEWCKEHWKLVVTIVIVAVAVVLLISGIGTGIGAAILAGACWGAIFGAVIGGVSGGIMSKLQGGSFFAGFEDGAFSGAIGGAIGGAITGGLTFAMGPAATFWGSVARGAGIDATSSGVSNMCVTLVDYLAEHRTLAGSFDDIIWSGISGIISGAISGGVTGGFVHVKSQLLVSDPKYLTHEGKIDWDKHAPNNGRVEGTVVNNQTIKQGTIIDRYGSKYGNYTSPIGTSFEARALPYKDNSWAYHKYMVIKDIDGVTTSQIAAAFGQPGGGIQFELPSSVKKLVEAGFLKEVFF